MSYGSGQYAKYEDQFKMQCILTAIAGGVAILALILLFFMPVFQYEWKGVVLMEFSIYDEAKLAMDILKGEKETEDYYLVFFGIYQIIMLLYLIFACGWMIFECARSALRVLNIGDYTLEQYDEIKRSGGVKKVRGRYAYGVTSAFTSWVGMELGYFLFLRILYNALSGVEGIEALGEPPSYFIYMNSVSSGIWLVVVVALLAWFVSGVASFVKKKIRIAILKEDYQI